MTPVPANIKVAFTANYNGQHRVCYRVGSSGSYTCITTTCTVGACEAELPIFVDNETCDTIYYEGYVQASCQDISSEIDRVPFALSFIPSPACKLYTVTCANSTVSSAVITDGGTNYLAAYPPSVLITGGGGTGATATTTVGEGKFDSGAASSFTPGSGYTNGSFTGVDVTGGSGSGAIASVVVSGEIVTAVSITSGGTGYLTTDTLGVDAADMGGAAPSVPATFQAVSDMGKVIAVNITSPGSGYTSVPTITIAIAAGDQALATAVLATCPAITTDGCFGSDVVIPSAAIDLGDSISVCNIGGPPTPGSQYTVVANGNCKCGCVTATIGVTGTVSTQVRYFYNKCNLEVRSGLLTVGGSPSSIIDCIVPGSLVFEILTPGTTGTVSYGGEC